MKLFKEVIMELLEYTNWVHSDLPNDDVSNYNLPTKIDDSAIKSKKQQIGERPQPLGRGSLGARFFFDIFLRYKKEKKCRKTSFGPFFGIS